MKKTDFTSEELESLYQILKEYEENSSENEEEYYSDHYDDYEEPINKKIISSILKKISKELPETSKKEIDKDFLRKKYHTYNNNVDEKVYRTLKKAFEGLKSVDIKYFDMDSAEFTERKIDVYYTSMKYTIAYCRLRKAIRKFRTSRIASAKLTESNYKIPKNFNKNDY